MRIQIFFPLALVLSFVSATSLMADDSGNPNDSSSVASPEPAKPNQETKEARGKVVTIDTDGKVQINVLGELKELSKLQDGLLKDLLNGVDIQKSISGTVTIVGPDGQRSDFHFDDESGLGKTAKEQLKAVKEAMKKSLGESSTPLDSSALEAIDEIDELEESIRSQAQRLSERVWSLHGRMMNRADLRQARLGTGSSPAPELSSLESKLDLILQRLDSLEKDVAELKQRPSS